MLVILEVHPKIQGEKKQFKFIFIKEKNIYIFVNKIIYWIIDRS
jgi:hypothetical protein